MPALVILQVLEISPALQSPLPSPALVKEKNEVVFRSTSGNRLSHTCCMPRSEPVLPPIAISTAGTQSVLVGCNHLYLVSGLQYGGI